MHVSRCAESGPKEELMVERFGSFLVPHCLVQSYLNALPGYRIQRLPSFSPYFCNITHPLFLIHKSQTTMQRSFRSQDAHLYVHIPSSILKVASVYLLSVSLSQKTCEAAAQSFKVSDDQRKKHNNDRQRRSDCPKQPLTRSHIAEI